MTKNNTKHYFRLRVVSVKCNRCGSTFETQSGAVLPIHKHIVNDCFSSRTQDYISRLEGVGGACPKPKWNWFGRISKTEKSEPPNI